MPTAAYEIHIRGRIPPDQLEEFEQDILGEHQDAVVAADLPRRMAAGTAGHPDENGFTYGLLYARELDRTEQSRRLAHHWAPKAATV